MAKLETGLDLRTVTITTNDGQDIGRDLSSMRFNAAITAVELRAMITAVDGVIYPSAFPDLAKASPLRVYAMGRLLTLVHFETVTIVPFELSASDGIAEEVAILRGARLDRVTPV